MEGINETKDLGALEQTIQDQAEGIFLQKLSKAIDKIKDDEDFEILRDLSLSIGKHTCDIMKYLKLFCDKKQSNSLSMPLFIFPEPYETEHKCFEEFKNKGINKIAMELSSDFLEQYSKKEEDKGGD